MKLLTQEGYRRRIDNISSADQSNKSYQRRHRIRDYMPGQVTYNLGDYPAAFSMEPTEYDYNLLKSLAENGVELLQIHEEWNDPIRHLGADKFTAHDPEGLQKFVDLCHFFGIKIIPYISTGYFQVTDPDYQECWERQHGDLIDEFFRYGHCWCGSPEWLEYLLPRTYKVLDQYGFDGIYNDWGYDGYYFVEQATGETDLAKMHLPYDPLIEDLLSEIYSEIKHRGGVYKIHADRNNAPPCKDKVYDYLWIGEHVDDDTPGEGKQHEPYIVPCQHCNYSKKMDDEDYYYARVIPFMQFPLLKHGRPLGGTGINEPGIHFYKDTSGYIFQQKVQEYNAAHPDGPFVHSIWSSIPDDVEEYPRWSRYLKLYKPMVTQNSVAYIELRDCDDILSPLPEKVIASMFVNEEKYMVVSNLTDADYKLKLSGKWKDRVTGEVGTDFVIKPDKILFLVQV
ncbi:MAG: hypothetical protein E7402_03290 [Ruminococcaceae bacterium]|nr:hypothetical protein [Oscillospiraceae bacterium]